MKCTFHGVEIIVTDFRKLSTLSCLYAKARPFVFRYNLKHYLHTPDVPKVLLIVGRESRIPKGLRQTGYMQISYELGLGCRLQGFYGYSRVVMATWFLWLPAAGADFLRVGVFVLFCETEEASGIKINY